MKFTGIPERGVDRARLLESMAALKADAGDADWAAGRSWSLVYYGGEEHTRFLQQVYGLYFSENGLSPTAFPSLRKFEAEVVAMVLDLLAAPPDAGGTMTSGGTESILLAMKTYRDRARAERPEVATPEILVPESAHPAFLKAAHYFGLRAVPVPLAPDFRTDLAALRARIGRDTICIVGSAPCYPHGVVDRIAGMGEIAAAHGIGLHVDACLGGFLLPFMREAGYPVPDFDFRIPGVTSISADLHKNGYAAKGASVIAYRTQELRRFQYFVSTDWPGGLYGSPTMLGTRPGGAIAAAWAAIVALGRDGYRDMAARTMQATATLTAGIRAIPGLHVVGEPDMNVLCIGSDAVDVFAVADLLEQRRWRIDRQARPRAIHLIVTPNHAQSIGAFLDDLRAATDAARAGRAPPADGAAASYGVTTRIRSGEDAAAAMRRAMDDVYRA
jgi:glutamate/tyrosine decarboxylase-like PLP-dependent enzyme